ncbi:MAG: hypothetical protein K2X76_16700 [Sphingomonas sp.]|nr:hypothetical protein [Sphingomonas sp.]
MRFDHALAGLAAAGLASAALPCPAATLRLAMCGDHPPIELPLPAKPKPDCAAACHAACPRRARLAPA